MGWSIGYIPPKEPHLLDEFFLAVGKALYLASSFESKCQYVLLIVKWVTHYEQGGDALATFDYAKTLKDKLLGKTINELSDFPEFNANDIRQLDEAREARNFIAHKGAAIGDLSAVSGELVYKQLDRLREQIKTLTAGDNIVSRWLYEIEEKEAAPKGIQHDYVGMVDKWVFHNLDKLRGA